jgi:hypothetical protein
MGQVVSCFKQALRFEITAQMPDGLFGTSNTAVNGVSGVQAQNSLALRRSQSQRQIV